MKSLFLTIFLSALFTGSLSLNPRYSIDDVINAMDTGDANQLSNYFDKMVEITLYGKSSSYSSSQAEMILRDFFHTYGVKAFRIVHKGSNSGSEFCIGILQTKYSQFRTTIFMKSSSQKRVLQEIRFEEKN